MEDSNEKKTINFTSDVRKKFVGWLFKKCDDYSIHEFHVHKAVCYAYQYFRHHQQTHERQIKIILSICVGLSLKMYEKEPITFYHLQSIFGYLALIKEMNDLEREILLAIRFNLTKTIPYEISGGPDKRILINYLLAFDGLEKFSISDIDQTLQCLIDETQTFINPECLRLIASHFKKIDMEIVEYIGYGNKEFLIDTQEIAYLQSDKLNESPSDEDNLNEDTQPMTFETVKKIAQISKSSEGIVFKGRVENNGLKDHDSIVAIKIYEAMPIEFGIFPNTLSDIVFQHLFKHDNIINSLGISYEHNKFINIMPLCATDFYKFIKQYNPILTSNPNTYYNLIKPILRAITQAVKYIHDFDIVHGDLKPQNILINQLDRSLLKFQAKITDFGSSRVQTFNSLFNRFNPDGGPTICTLWYRPIEILLGQSDINDKIDIWSLGCIFAEAAMGRTLFTVEDELEMIKQIFNTFDSPNPLDRIIQLPLYERFCSITNMKTFKYRFNRYAIPDDLKKLIASMLRFDPNKRPLIDEVLNDAYFDVSYD
jgi:hypothetical protein